MLFTLVILKVLGILSFIHEIFTCISNLDYRSVLIF